MMGNTHIVVGVATSLAVMQPTNIKECLVSVIGGAVGGAISDIDIVRSNLKHDFFNIQLISMLIALSCLGVDYLLNFGICQDVLANNRQLVIIGGAAYITLLLIGFLSSHRTFTHSLLSVLLFTVALEFVYVPIAISHALGHLSHLVLDFSNRKRMTVLFPIRRGICLKLFYADRTANKIFWYLGWVVSIVFATRALYLHFF